MTSEKMLNLPASCSILSEDEMMYTEGGGLVENVVGGVIAIGATLALAYAGGSIIGGIGSLFGETAVGTALMTGGTLMAAPGAAVASVVGGLVSDVLGIA